MATPPDDPKNPSKKDGHPPLYDMDLDHSGTAEMPSITKLLKRKTLKGTKTISTPALKPSTPAAAPAKPAPATQPTVPKPAAAAPPKPVAPPPPTSSNTGSAPVIEKVPSPTPSVRPAVRSAPPTTTSTMPSLSLQSLASNTEQNESTGVIVLPARRGGSRAVATGIKIWNPGDIKTSQEPLLQVVSQLVERGMTGALYLSYQLTEGPSAAPIFRAAAGFAPGSKPQLWTGLTWNPALTPTLWKLLSMSGSFELTPPEGNTQATNERSAIRTAFGVDHTEYLVIALVGSPAMPFGMLATLSTKPFAAEVQRLTPQLSRMQPPAQGLKRAG